MKISQLTPTNIPYLRHAACLSALLMLAACGGGGVGDDLASASALASSPVPVANVAVRLNAPAPGAKKIRLPPPATVAGPQILVQIELGTNIQALANAQGLSVVSQFGRRPIYRLQAPLGADAEALAAALAGAPGVVFAEPNAISETPEGKRNTVWAIGGDSGSFAAQWAPGTLRLSQAHVASMGSGVRVAVLDTGIEVTHPVFAGRLARRNDGSLLGRDFVDDDSDPSEQGSRVDVGYGHGTHVAGLVVLAAPQAQIMPLRVLNPAGEGNTWVLAEALAWAVDPDSNPNTDDGAHLINMSLGSTRPTRLLNLAVQLANCEFDDDDDDDDLDHPGFDDDRSRCAQGHGAAVFSAAGNDGSPDIQIFPAAEGEKGTRAVTATSSNQRLASFANSGGWIKLAAPGDQIMSAVPGGAWGTWSGTSMAAPLATGTAALVLTTTTSNPRPGAVGLRQWQAEDVMKRLEDRAKAVCDGSVKQIDAAAAVTDTAAPDPICP